MARGNLFLFVSHAKILLDQGRKKKKSCESSPVLLHLLTDAKPLGHWNVLRCQVQSQTRKYALKFKDRPGICVFVSFSLCLWHAPMTHFFIFQSRLSYPITSFPGIRIPGIYPISDLPSFRTSLLLHVYVALMT